MLRFCDFCDTVRALCTTLVVDLLSVNAFGVEDPSIESHIVDFVTNQHARMPAHLRVGVRIATFLFDLWSLATRGKRMHRLSLEQRQHLIAQWRSSRIGLFRDFIRFYETLSIFCLAGVHSV